MELRQWLATATPAARRIARKIIQDAHPVPLHTHRIYALSQTVKPTPEEEHLLTQTHARLLRRTGPAMPPNPTHPIRSLRYLKHVVLEDLAARNEIIKICHRRPATPDELARAPFFRPLTLSQRKNRGALGPGQRPVEPEGGTIKEWAWRIKTQDDEEMDRVKGAERARRDALRKEMKREEIRKRNEGKPRRVSAAASQHIWAGEQKNYFLPGLKKRT